MRLQLETEGNSVPFTPPGGGGALVAFLSFALSRGFGAQHPLIALADRLHDHFHVPFGPLTTFYDGVAEDAEDREKLEQAWQPPRPLREALETSAEAMTTDEQCQALLRRADAGDVAGEASSLIPPLREAEAANARVRMVYAL
jgi:hypothetical protein